MAALSLREVARRVGMKAPSLYEYFDSKDAVYDAMFAEAWMAFREAIWHSPSDETDVVADLKARIRQVVDFANADPARYQLMFQRTIPGFEPSPEAYAESLAAYEEMRAEFARLGVTEQRYLDLWTAIGAGLMSQQISNDPGGDRWARLVDEAVDMYLAHVSAVGGREPENPDPSTSQSTRRNR